MWGSGEKDPQPAPVISLCKSNVIMLPRLRVGVRRRSPLTRDDWRESDCTDPPSEINEGCSGPHRPPPQR